MTSANSSLTKAMQSGQNPHKRQNKTGRGAFAWHRNVFGRRVWALGLTILYLVLYYPAGTAMIISRSDYRATLYGYDAAQTLTQRLYEVSKWIGIRQNFWIVPICLGIFLGIEGFSYLFSMTQMDFYESQPMPRRRRFAQVYLNGVLIFGIPFVISYALAVLLAACMGGMTGLLLLEILVGAVRILILFLASYSIAVFAATLSGNTGIAICVSSMIMLAEFVYWSALNGLAQTFYKTIYYGYNGLNGHSIGELRWFWISPLSRVLDEQLLISDLDNYQYIPYTAATLRQALRAVLPSTGCMLLVGLVFLSASYGLFLRRRSEAAGGTVIYEPARFLCKMIVVIGGALFLGTSMYYSIFTEISGDQNAVTVMTIIAMLITVVLLCGIIQGIYEMNARRFLGRIWHMAVAGVVVSAVFAIYRYDLTGYDRYLPAISEVESGALVSYGNDSFQFEDPQNAGSLIGGTQYSQNYMQIHDIYTLEQIARIGQEALRNEDEELSEMNGWYGAVVYQLKNGRQVARSIFLPDDIDSALMDQIVGSEDYKKGFFPVYQENNSIIAATMDKAALIYTNGVDQQKAEGALYQEFCTAYRKDLEQFNYTYATTHSPIGSVIYTYDGEDQFIYSMLPVYPDFTSTIQFLKEHAIFVEAVEVSETVAQIEVYFYSYDGALTANYTDAEQIEEILQSSVPQALGDVWTPASSVDGDYRIDLFSANPGGDIGYSYRLFKAGQVPAFVVADLGTQQ